MGEESVKAKGETKTFIKSSSKQSLTESGNNNNVVNQAEEGSQKSRNLLLDNVHLSLQLSKNDSSKSSPATPVTTIFPLPTLKKAEKDNDSVFQNDAIIPFQTSSEDLPYTTKKTVRTGWRRYLGIILAVSSSMVFALAILIVKSLPQYHPFSVSLWRFQGVFLPSIPIVFYYRVIKKERIFSAFWPLSEPGHLKMLVFLFLRGIVGATAVMLQFYSLQFMNMADASVIAFSTPVFVSLASHFLLGEKSGVIPILSGVITLLGVVVITRPPMLTGGDFDTNTLIGSGLAFACMLFAAGTFLILRVLRQLHFSTITLFFGFWGSFQSIALATTVSTFQPPEGAEHWGLAVTLAMLTFIGQTCITLAFKFETAGTVSLCRTCDPLFAYVWQFVFLGVAPDVFSLIGGGIVISGILIVGFRKFVSELPEDNSMRQRFWMVLK